MQRFTPGQRVRIGPSCWQAGEEGTIVREEKPPEFDRPHCYIVRFDNVRFDDGTNERPVANYCLTGL